MGNKIPRIKQYTHNGVDIVKNYKWTLKTIPKIWTDGNHLFVIDYTTRNVAMLSVNSCFAGESSGFRLEYYPENRYSEDIGTFFYIKKDKEFLFTQW